MKTLTTILTTLMLLSPVERDVAFAPTIIPYNLPSTYQVEQSAVAIKPKDWYDMTKQYFIRLD